AGAGDYLYRQGVDSALEQRRNSPERRLRPRVQQSFGVEKLVNKVREPLNGRQLNAAVAIQQFATQNAGIGKPTSTVHHDVNRRLEKLSVWIEKQNVLSRRAGKAEIIRAGKTNILGAFDYDDFWKVLEERVDVTFGRSIVHDEDF